MPKPNYASSQRTHFKTHSKENKCNQCYCASFQKRIRRTHLKKKWIRFAHTLRKRLKTHNMEKSNKCNQCAYKSSHVDNLRTYLKTHNSKKAKPMQPMQLYFHTGNLRTQRTYSGKKVIQSV